MTTIDDKARAEFDRHTRMIEEHRRSHLPEPAVDTIMLELASLGVLKRGLDHWQLTALGEDWYDTFRYIDLASENHWRDEEDVPGGKPDASYEAVTATMHGLGLITEGPKPYLTDKGTEWCDVLRDVSTWSGNLDCVLKQDGQRRH